MMYLCIYLAFFCKISLSSTFCWHKNLRLSVVKSYWYNVWHDPSTNMFSCLDSCPDFDWISRAPHLPEQDFLIDGARRKCQNLHHFIVCLNSNSDTSLNWTFPSLIIHCDTCTNFDWDCQIVSPNISTVAFTSAWTCLNVPHLSNSRANLYCH